MTSTPTSTDIDKHIVATIEQARQGEDPNALANTLKEAIQQAIDEAVQAARIDLLLYIEEFMTEFGDDPKFIEYLSDYVGQCLTTWSLSQLNINKEDKDAVETS